MRITDLKCESFTNPLGIDAPHPRLNWRLESDRRGARQSACRLLVSSDEPALAEGCGDLWDSGKVESDRTAHVAYEGEPLRSRERAWWTVRVWDENGDACDAAPVAFWEMGLLAASDWQAAWIGGSLAGGPRTPVPTPFLRRTFDIAAKVKYARLRATALGLYECEINGSRVGDHVLAPGWTDYRKRLLYQTYDVTALLKPGENVWGTALGDGWAVGHVGWSGRQHYSDRPKFLGQLDIEYEDGARVTVTSDGSWRAAYGPVLQADLIEGEHFDSRLDFPGWSAPGFDAANWLSAATFPPVEAELCAPLGPPVRRVEELAPARPPHRVEEAWIFDFGQNIAGRVRLKVTGPRGTTVKLRWSHRERVEGGGGRVPLPVPRPAKYSGHHLSAPWRRARSRRGPL